MVMVGMPSVACSPFYRALGRQFALILRLAEKFFSSVEFLISRGVIVEPPYWTPPTSQPLTAPSVRFQSTPLCL